MAEYKPIEVWKRSKEDEDVQLEALFDALYAAKKVTEDDLFIYLSNKNTRNRGYIYPKREAVHHFMRYQLIYEAESFLGKMNCCNHSPIDLANQIYERVLKAIEHEDEGVAFYTCMGAPAVMGTIVCMGKMQDGKYITNPTEGAPRQLVDKLTPNDILMFLTKYGKWFKDPLLMFGVWRTYPASSAADYGPWMMCLCHHLGTGRREDYYEYAFDAGLDAIDYIGTEF
ncbi:MAG: hypothetical protein ACI351_07590 [Candidatus Avelusimicrobium sp.]|uniref:hypothetical protein n=1 Tax=Candidatus Avelusimicrobium sp. TaxID=3048833 RepID=UPI003F07B0BA